MTDATVIVHFDEHGELNYHVHGDARLYIVDERAPHDRVFEWLSRSTADEIAAIIPVGEVIGNSRDERGLVLGHKAKAWLDGRPRLVVVEGE